MREFFLGWRRKVGVLTLVTACVAMVGWMRSETQVDYIGLRLGGAVYSCGAYSGDLHLDCTELTEVVPFVTFGSMTLSHLTEKLRQIDKGMEDRELEIRFFPKKIPGSHFGTVYFGRTPVQKERIRTRITVSFWSITIPLALITTLLLLSKPRQSTPKKTALPIQDEGGRATS